MNNALLEEISHDAEAILHTVEAGEEKFYQNLKEELDQSDSETAQVLEQIEQTENNIDFSVLTGIQKTRAIRQKIELKNLEGQSLSMFMPEINDRAIFRTVFQILFQAQRLKNQLNDFASAAGATGILSDLNDVLVTGSQSSRLDETQKSELNQLLAEIDLFKLELSKPLVEQSLEKIKKFEKVLDEKIEVVNQWVEPFIPQFL